MLEASILGIIQGIAEWLPVSSEGFLVLAQVRLFGSEAPLEDLIRISLFLHLGTFLAALIYFRKDVLDLTYAIFRWNKATQETRKVFQFLAVSTLISGTLGILLLWTIGNIVSQFDITGRAVALSVGLLLLVTAALQLFQKGVPGAPYAGTFGELRTPRNLNILDGIILGIVQGFTVLPGLSRSGLTVAALMLRKIDDIYALRLSFLMSLPIVLAGNIALNLTNFTFDKYALLGLAFSFIFGLLTIHWLLKLARYINFGFFLLGLAFLMILASFL